MKNKTASLVFFITLILFFDQATKYSLKDEEGSFLGFMQVLHTENSYTAFGSHILHNRELIFINIILLIFSLFTYYQFNNLYLEIGLSSLIGGGASNLADRILNRAVNDIFAFNNIFFFNLADMFLVLGFLIIIIALLHKKDINSLGDLM